MFRCTECGSEYKTKPDFCDCGNDTFEEIYETLPKSEKIKKPIEFNKFGILSWLIFLLCIVLSILILLFFPKIEPQQNASQHKQEVQRITNPNIPSLESFWINPQPKPEVVEPEPEPIEQIKELFRPKVEQKPVAKPAAVKKVQQTTTKPVQQTQKPKTVQTTQKPNQQMVKTPAQANRTLDYAMLNYRSALRMRLLSNLVTSGVVGSGTCEIEFAVDDTGKLINRNFVSQSNNETVNKAIYEMLMRTPRYNPPPESYDGRKIRMIFKLSEGGNYETSFSN